MGYILLASGKAACAHGAPGNLSSLGGTPTRKVSSTNILTEAHTGAVSFSCPANSPCTSITGWIPNQTRMKIDGKLVLTDRSIPVTNNGPGQIIESGQKNIIVK